MLEQGLAVAGIVLNLAGVLMLFHYGMPFRVETKGASAFLMEETDHEAIKIEKRYRALGKVGLFLVVGGSALQTLAVCLT